jgi:hypothetical protein
MPLPGEPQCVAAQLVPGKSTLSYGAGALGTTSVYIRQQFRNTGSACTLDLPASIGVSQSTGLFTPVAVSNAGTTRSVVIPAGSLRSVVLGAWWPIAGYNSRAGTAGACQASVANVTRAHVPLSMGSLPVQLGMRLPAVCLSPASVSLAIAG